MHVKLYEHKICVWRHEARWPIAWLTGIRTESQFAGAVGLCVWEREWESERLQHQHHNKSQQLSDTSCKAEQAQTIATEWLRKNSLFIISNLFFLSCSRIKNWTVIRFTVLYLQDPFLGAMDYPTGQTSVKLAFLICTGECTNRIIETTFFFRFIPLDLLWSWK